MITRCPDRQLLSVYFDGELPSPWKEKMEAHIAGCGKCARQLEAYRHIARTSADEHGPDMESARQRIWRKLEQSTGYPARRNLRMALWRRSIAIPLPAAAALVLIVLLAFLIALRVTRTAEPSVMSFASDTELDTPGIIPVADMEDVLQYLGSRDNGDIIILRLPESRSFVNYSEPAIFNAADYSRNVSNRNTMRGRKP